MSENNPLNAALKYLDHQAYSEQKLAQKLAGDGFTEDAIHDAISQLKNLGYLNDYQLGESRIHQLQVKLKSRRYTIFDLENHGLSKEIINELMKKYYSPDQELEIAVKLLAKKNAAHKSQDKTRVYLVRNGFSENTVSHCFPSIDHT
jgi:SOS response regulatory protein OraA/RecX